ncbi:MAG TPA: hydroxymethylpyrimidine/phosphomethylpyrimidine kinase [Candidatus Tumulicola sp.]
MIVLSIGTTHPWNVAGTGRDIAVGTALGARVFTAIAAVSAQDGGGVRALAPVEPTAFEAQLETLPWQAAGAVRVGALPSASHVAAVEARLQARPDLLAVADPVIRATLGGSIVSDEAAAAVGTGLSRLASVILTPNLAEAAQLLDVPPPTRETMRDAAAALVRRGPFAVLLKGGHLEGDPVDVLATHDSVEVFTEPRLVGQMRGTGCTLAMALACELARGVQLNEAVRSARAFVRAQIAAR